MVPNGSFEDTVACPKTGGDINLCKYWFDPTLASSDYYNSCSISNSSSIPLNFLGYQKPFDGNAYAGIVNYRESNDNFREYISVKLKRTFEADKKYLIEFFVSLSDSSKYATNNIGIGFSFDTIKSNNIFAPLNTSNLNISNIINDTSSWTKITFEYIAEGDENFVIIGNFYDYSQTQIAIVNNQLSSYYDYSYYYIDNISIVESKTNLENSNLFTPNGDYKNDVFKINVEEYCEFNFSIYNRWGNIIFYSDSNNQWDGRYKGTLCPVGTYYYLLEGTRCDGEKKCDKGFIQLIY